MKKMSLSLLFLIIILNISGCSLKGGFLGVTNVGEPRESYEPVYIDKAPESELAYIKTAGGIIIVSVDGDRKVNFAKVMVGIGIDSIKIKEGEHTIDGFIGADVRIGTVYYKKGHEYLIDYAKGSSSYGRQTVHYWVKDLTNNKIVYGKEI